jgi:hypothetical protein
MLYAAIDELAELITALLPSRSDTVMGCVVFAAIA